MVESNIRRKLASKEPIMLWLVRWAAMVASRYLVGKDGRTAYVRKRGRMCKMPLAIFGEKVWYRPMDKYKDRSKIEARWEEGLWLGLTRESN